MGRWGWSGCCGRKVVQYLVEEAEKKWWARFVIVGIFLFLIFLFASFIIMFLKT